MNMPKRMTKNAKVVPLSLGQATVLRGLKLLENYSAYVVKTQIRNASKSELFELALNLGFSILEPIAEFEKWSELEEVKKRVSRLAKRKVNEPRTVGQLTDEDIEKLEKGEQI